MDLATLSYRPDLGWSDRLPSELDSPQTLILAFGTSDLARAESALGELRRHFTKGVVAGCSTAGEIDGTTLLDGGLTVAIARFEATQLKSVWTPACRPGESFAAGVALAQGLAKPDLRGVFVVSDGLNVNGSELVRGMSSVLPRSVVITGGLAGDGDRFQGTWVVHNGHAPQARQVVAVGLYGERVAIGHGSKGGWDLFGPQRTVTRAQANVLYELDRRPALQLYKEYLGECAAGLPATALLFPLAIRTPGAPDDRVVRTVLSVNEAQQSMTFAGDVPEGSCVQLMRANFDRLIEGASGAATMVRMAASTPPPLLSVAISCVGRRLVLRERTEEELEATLDVLPAGTKQIGFYSYGEISPYTDGTCDLHNQTMTLTLLGESG